MLPPGTLAALRGHHNGIVSVVMFASAGGVMAAGAPPWAVVVLLAITLVMFHIRCNATESHDRAMATLRIEEALARTEAIKARHRMLRPEQPDLPLERGPAIRVSQSFDDKGVRQ